MCLVLGACGGGASGPDASLADASSPDASLADASSPDASPPDASPPDAGPPDASPPDARARDVSLPDFSLPDAAAPPVCEDVVAERSLLLVSSTLAAGRLGLNHASTGEDILGPSGSPLVDPAAPLQPTLTLHDRPNGFDLEIVYENGTGLAQPLGMLTLRGLKLDAPSIVRRTFRDSATSTDPWSSADPEVVTFPSPSAPACTDFCYLGPTSYPRGMYSPLTVLSDTRYHVGIALHYPLLEYRHSVMFDLKSESVAGDPTRRAYWLDLVFPDAGAAFEDGVLAAGATRSYTLAVRVVPSSEHWLHTVVPYRNSFRSLYGGVRYERDPRPVVGALTAFGELCAEDNPYGMLPLNRADVRGWSPWVDETLTALTEGYERAMLWTPTGVYCTNQQHNYPSQFMTQMLAVPMMRDTQDELLRIPQAGLDSGFWWGRATKIMRSWDVDESVPLDPEEAEHVALAYAELDRAVALGATTIGLDAFADAQGDWMGYEWLQALQSRAPGVKFVTEAFTSDLVHSLAPTFTEAAPYRGPHELADFLLPGNEIWGQVRYDQAFPNDPQWFNRDNLERQAEIARTASIGMVPVVMHDSTTLLSSYEAAETWRATIPVELQGPCEGR